MNEDRLEAIEKKLDRILLLLASRPKARPGLTDNEQSIFDRLVSANGGVVSAYDLAAGLPSNVNGNRNSDDDRSIIKTYVFNLRKKGFPVQTHSYKGYSIPKTLEK